MASNSNHRHNVQVIPQPERKRHDCAQALIINGRREAWAECATCGGRMHLEGCTSRRDKKKDCCPARHEMLYQQGHHWGLYDRSQPMLDANEIAALNERLATKPKTARARKK